MDEIKELRKKLGLSQQELASKLGLSISTITKWEASDHTPSRLSIRKLSKRFGKDCLNG